MVDVDRLLLIVRAQQQALEELVRQGSNSHARDAIRRARGLIEEVLVDKPALLRADVPDEPLRDPDGNVYERKKP
jgi:hypothetical protein